LYGENGMNIQMKPKLIRINNCGDCPHLNINEIIENKNVKQVLQNKTNMLYWCAVTRKDIGKKEHLINEEFIPEFNIPNWCPLEDG
jgi:hypothetical protein